MLKRFFGFAAALLASTVAWAAAEDITQLSTIATNSPATIRRIHIRNPKLVVHREFQLAWPLIRFTVSNKSRTAVSRLIIEGDLRARGRAVPLLQHNIDYAVPGGLKPGETKTVLLDADVIGGWSGLTPQEVCVGRLTLRLSAIDDAEGKRLRE